MSHNNIIRVYTNRSRSRKTPQKKMSQWWRYTRFQQL